MPELQRHRSSYVVTRDGKEEIVRFDKIVSRIQKLSYGLDQTSVDFIEVAQVVIASMFPGITTTQLDDLAAEAAAGMIGRHPDYGVLAGRIAVSNLHKNTPELFSEVVHKLFTARNNRTGEPDPIVSESFYNLVKNNAKVLDAAILLDRDYLFSFFAIKKLEKTYLLKVDGVIVERPQHMFMRLALGVHGDNIVDAIKMYNAMSDHSHSYGTPALCNGGTLHPQMSSSFIVMMQADSIDGIFETLKKCAIISKCAGGIGLAVHNIRSTGAAIAGTGGISNGLVPMLRVFNNTANYVEQGNDKKPGSIRIYLEPWHPDVLQTFDLNKKEGDELARCRNLDFALWVPDLFMKRVKDNAMWSFMCPAECPGLYDVWGDEFEELYTKYEGEGRYRKQMNARKVWELIVTAQIETGMPSIVYKDTCNRKSNHKHLGTVKGLNFGAESVQYSCADQLAPCFMASIAVNKFVADTEVDYKRLHKVVKEVTVTLNRMLDVNYYPLAEIERSAKQHRAIGIGVQGLADAFILMRCGFTSARARDANKRIFETLYHAALESSCELAAKYGPFETYSGSPASEGILQYDMWGVVPTDQWNWGELKAKIAKYGLRNSLVTSQMSSSSASQIVGNNEGIQPYLTNVHSRHLSTDFQVFNPHLLKDLIALDLWDEEMRVDIVVNKGSIQGVDRIPSGVRELYKTVWELPQKDLIDMALDRAPFIDQSQSLDIFIARPTFANCTSMHFYGWQKGLKTGLRYLKSRSNIESETHFKVDEARIWEKSAKEHNARISA